MFTRRLAMLILAIEELNLADAVLNLAGAWQIWVCDSACGSRGGT
jgi:hypothetical protein